MIVRVKGGLGNQLFCYAAGRRLTLVNEAELVLDHVSGFVRDFTFRRKYGLDVFSIPVRKATPHERMEPLGRYRRAWARLAAKCRPFCSRRYLMSEGPDFDERLMRYQVGGTVYLDGYWQSEGYFKDVEDIIREDLQITPPDDEINRAMAEQILSRNAVAVHVRWFESPEATRYQHNMGSSYYGKAIQEIRDRVTSPHFFVFSDQPEAAIETLGLSEEVATCVSHNKGDENAYADLWLMSQCRHFIIANSTFSWWGAWLSQHKGKIVVAPGIVQSGISSWGFKGLLPDEWIQA